jgi:hypothetical protein
VRPIIALNPFGFLIGFNEMHSGETEVFAKAKDVMLPSASPAFYVSGCRGFESQKSDCLINVIKYKKY